jgi:SAM-dependent methyltransferase
MHEAVDEPLAFDPDDENAWHQLARGYRLAGLLLSAHRLGLLPRLLDGQATLDALSADLGADPKLLEQMCRALATAGLLRAGDVGWRLSEAGRRLLTNPAAAAELDSLARDYRRWGALDERARAGVGEASEDDVDRTRSDVDSARQYALRLAARHRGQAVALLDRLEPTRPVRVMDVGGADGFLVREVCARWPDAECVVLEEPSMAEVARRACRDEARISVVAGNFLGEGSRLSRDPLPGDADVVVLSHVLQGRPEARQRALTTRAAAALRPGGCLLSCESVLRSDQHGPLDTVLWAVGQFALRREGHMLTTVEQDVLLRAAGLAASAAWWVSDSTRAVVGVRPDAGVEPALRVAL